MLALCYFIIRQTEMGKTDLQDFTEKYAKCNWAVGEGWDCLPCTNIGADLRAGGASLGIVFGASP